jgi:Ser/Thr protein kinase RdoA (MazF antagonist)
MDSFYRVTTKTNHQTTREAMPSQDGLEWVATTFGLEPRWTKEPNIDVISRIARARLGHKEEVAIDVTFYAQGAFNKLYKIKASEYEWLMRVSLPVHPSLKTKSEVATIEFVRKETDMPVPRILAFDSDYQNELGFEWILMEMMPGITLRQKWRTMSWSAKETIVRRLVRYQAQLLEKTFQETGNLFQHTEGSESFNIGPIVSLAFFWANRLSYDVLRGPFENAYDWLQTRLEFVITDQDSIIKSTDNKDDIEDAEFARELAEDLSRELLKVFPKSSTDPECTVLFHDDLSMQNILVDKEGRLTAVLDWECVSALPWWRACQLPQLLEGRSRDEEPTRIQYMADSNSEDDDPSDFDALDNEGVNNLYWEHLLEYEQTQLRRLFVEEMEKVKSDWVTTMRSSTVERDFEKAIQNCDNAWNFKTVRRWLEDYKQGHVENLAAKLIE